MTQSQWISIDERLPEHENEEILATDGQTVVNGYFYKDLGFMAESALPNYKFNPTHWMPMQPLPEPPHA